MRVLYEIFDGVKINIASPLLTHSKDYVSGPKQILESVNSFKYNLKKTFFNTTESRHASFLMMFFSANL